MSFAALAVAGCAKKESDQAPPLGFEFDSTTTDTAKLAQGSPLLSGFEPYRATNGAIRARGRMELPDGARIQVSLRRADGRELGREQVVLIARGFETPPFLDPGGHPFPPDVYQFEVSTQFNSVWQPPNVLRATRDGLALTGPGMRRGHLGEAIYRMTLEKKV